MEAGYQELINRGYDKIELNRLRTALDVDTVEALYLAGKKSGVDLVDNAKVYMQTFIDNVVNVEKTGTLRAHHLKDQDLTGAMKGLAGSLSDTLKKALVGCEPAKMIRNSASEITNRYKWLSRFGVFGAVLLTGTVLATLFFGHIPQKEMYMKDGK